MQDKKDKTESSLIWIIKAVKPVLPAVVMLTVVQSLLSAALIAQALMMRSAVDTAVAGNKSGFITAVAILFGIIALQILMKAIAGRMDESVKAETENVLKERSYKAILNSSYAEVTEFHTGELQNRMTNDTVVIADGVATVIPDTVALAIRMAGAAAVLFMMDWRFALIFVFGGLMVMAAAYLFRSKAKRLHKMVQEADDHVRSFLQETVSGMLIIKSFGREQNSSDEASILMDKHKKERLKKNMFSVICNIGFGVMMRGGYLFGLIWCGFGIINGTISYGTLAAVLQLVGQIQAPAVSLTGYLPKYFAMLASAERLMELEQMTHDKSSDISSSDAEDASASIGSGFDDLEVRNVTFSYGGEHEEQVLQNVSLNIKNGEFIALRGESGAGKSTLLKLMLAVYEPVEGEILFKFKDGSVKRAGADTRKLLAYVPQGLLLLSGNLYEAVSFSMNDDIDKEKVKASCHAACADFVDSLPDGLDTVIGESGEGLSEGQKQRIAIARAIYADAPVILLDEATSALDEKTEYELLERLRRLTDKTVVIVTHRKAALEFCDKVYEIVDRRCVKA
ncbi:MAG: ABC transporter ATP-binding protein [Eubacterium sp.]|nr:ABC transporter ATP-binding protein [Eubacterium sp.]